MSVEQVEYEEFKEKLPEFMGKVQLTDEAQVIITKHGVPLAKLINYHTPPRRRRLGVAEGKFIIPDDFDTMMSDEIAEMFGVK